MSSEDNPPPTPEEESAEAQWDLARACTEIKALLGVLVEALLPVIAIGGRLLVQLRDDREIARAYAHTWIAPQPFGRQAESVAAMAEHRFGDHDSFAERVLLGIAFEGDVPYFDVVQLTIGDRVIVAALQTVQTLALSNATFMRNGRRVLPLPSLRVLRGEPIQLTVRNRGRVHQRDDWHTARLSAALIVRVVRPSPS